MATLQRVTLISVPLRVLFPFSLFLAPTPTAMADSARKAPVAEDKVAKIQCGRCGSMVKKAKFCSKCGNPFLCKTCGTEIETDDGFCSNCGLDPRVLPAATAPLAGACVLR